MAANRVAVACRAIVYKQAGEARASAVGRRWGRAELATDMTPPQRPSQPCAQCRAPLYDDESYAWYEYKCALRHRYHRLDNVTCIRSSRLADVLDAGLRCPVCVCLCCAKPLERDIDPDTLGRATCGCYYHYQCPGARAPNRALRKCGRCKLELPPSHVSNQGVARWASDIHKYTRTYISNHRKELTAAHFLCADFSWELFGQSNLLLSDLSAAPFCLTYGRFRAHGAAPKLTAPAVLASRELAAKILCPSLAFVFGFDLPTLTRDVGLTLGEIMALLPDPAVLAQYNAGFRDLLALGMNKYLFMQSTIHLETWVSLFGLELVHMMSEQGLGMTADDLVSMCIVHREHGWTPMKMHKLLRLDKGRARKIRGVVEKYMRQHV